MHCVHAGPNMGQTGGQSTRFRARAAKRPVVQRMSVSYSEKIARTFPTELLGHTMMTPTVISSAVCMQGQV